MKTKLTSLILALTASFAFGHGDIELGPNKGRILEFSKDETIHGEVTEKDGKLHIALLDKDMKPMKSGASTITATAGTRAAPEKLDVETSEQGFTIPLVPAGQWIIFQYKPSEDAKAVTARLHFNTTVCDPCKQPEWRCACDEE